MRAKRLLDIKNRSRRGTTPLLWILLFLLGLYSFRTTSWWRAYNSTNVATAGSLDDLPQMNNLRSSASQVLGQHSSTGTAAAAVFSPPQCSASDLDMIQTQLPDAVCRRSEKFPWTNKCPLSFVTRCPDATWLSDFYSRLALSQQQQQEQQRVLLNQQQTKRRTAIYVGCNKAMDAINTLRMLSNNPAIDKFAWRDAFFENQTVVPGHCNQEFEPQYTINNNNNNNNDVIIDTVVHCLEAMPTTARHLARTAARLQVLDGSLLVANVAASNVNGWAYFPDAPDGKTVGIEGLGLSACSNPREVAKASPGACANVSVVTLDSLLLPEHHDHDDDTTTAAAAAGPAAVDLLSIDVEGYDFNVLLGAQRLLPRVRYLEFEYNWKKPWGDQDLKTATEYLEGFGFVCYWAGNKGHVWRITNCWWDSYNLHFWSNVACVNGRDAVVRSMAEQLEEMFQATLREGSALAMEIDKEFRAFYNIGVIN